MGEEKLDNAVYLIRGLYDLADMAAAKQRPDDRRGGRSGLADRLRGALRHDVVGRGVDRSTPTRSTDPDNRRSSRSTGSASRRWRPS